MAVTGWQILIDTILFKLTPVITVINNDNYRLQELQNDGREE